MADYAISNVPRRVVYAASGVGPYAFTFEILAAGDIAVYKASTLLTLTTDYTVTINANGTGSVTLVVTAGTSNITIVGSKTIARTTDFTTGGDFFANTLNDELDAQTIFIQQVAETAERGLKAPVVDPTDIAMTLPSKDNRKGKVLAFDSTTGNPVAGPALDAVVTVIEQSANINTVADNIASVNTVAGNTSNINTVAGVSGSVTTVATNVSNVNTVADDLNEPVSEINTVAVNIANVNTVGTNITNVNTVAGINAAVSTVATNATSVNTVSTNIANVNATGSNIANVNAVGADLLEPTSEINTVAVDIANVNTVGTNIANVNTVAGISANVTSVAGNSTNINTVATNIANVNSVGGNIANVNSVAGNATNINTVAGISANVTTVAGISGNVTTVATNNANVTTVAGSIANVNTNATNIANINQNAANIVAIQNASANATTATTQAGIATTQAAAASASAAAASAVALGNEPVRHSVRPSLLLDFANTKQLDPRITFTRASTATYYDGKTVAKAEENLFQYSQEFDNAYWSKTNLTVTANSTTAPDGTTTAETLTASAGTFGVRIFRAVTNPATNTTSFYVKAGTHNFVQINYTGDGTSFVNFNVTAGAGAVGTSAGTVTGSIVDAGNGWYRCVAVNTSTAVVSYLLHLVASSSDTRAANLTAAGTETVFLWGAQLEQRSAVTAYTPTTTAPITNYVPVLLSAPANVARFEHNPVTGESLGLEIEELRTNLVTYSDDFSNAAWTKSLLSVTSNTITAPDGTLTGDKLVEDTSLLTHSAQQSANIVSGTSYTLSCYVKAAGRNFTQLLMLGGFASNITAIFDLTTGAVGTTNGSPTTQAVNVGNGWWRLSMTATATSTTTTSIQLRPAFSSSNAFYQGDGFSGIYIWGAQLEAGAFATSYIPTVASQVTRSADSASMTGTNFSSWYRADEGTVYVESSVTPNSNGAYITIANGSSATGYIDIQRNVLTSNTRALGSNTLSITETTASSTSSIKTALALKLNDCSMSVNGNTSIADTSTTQLSDLSELQIGRYSTSFANVSIKKLAYYPKRLTNQELVGLTTV